MRSRALCRGKISPRCVPRRQSVAIFSLHVSQKGPRTGKSPLPGKIRTPCIRNELVLARYARYVSEKPRKPPLEDTPREYLARKGPFSLHKLLESRTARRSCHDSAFARPCGRKSRGAGYRKCTSYCGRRPHHRGCARLRQPCTIMAAAALWPVAQTHGSQCCGERAVQRCVCTSCPAASVRPQCVSCQRHPPARSNLRRRRFSAAAHPMTAACPHGASCSTAAARTSSVGGAPRHNTKNGQRLLAVFCEVVS